MVFENAVWAALITFRSLCYIVRRYSFSAHKGYVLRPFEVHCTPFLSNSPHTSRLSVTERQAGNL